MKNKPIKLLILLMLVFLPVSVNAYNETCTSPNDASCCIPPQAIIDGGGCPSGTYWIGGLDGSCQAPSYLPSLSCAVGKQFKCATNTCYTPPPGPTCAQYDVSIGTTASCCTNGQVAVYNTTTSKWECADITAAAGQWTLSGTNIYNTNTGNVGIGIATPAEKLDIRSGNVRIYGNPSNNNYARLDLKTTNNEYYLQAEDTTFDGIGFYKALPATAGWQMVLTTAGNVGIGTPTPFHKVDLADASGYGIGGVRVISKDTGTAGAIHIGTGADSFTGSINFDTNGSNRMIITNVGNVGIGSPTPDAPLNIESSVSFAFAGWREMIRLEHKDHAAITYYEPDSNTGWLQGFHGNADPNMYWARLSNYTGGVGDYKMILSSDGDLTVEGGAKSRIYMGGAAGDDFGIAYSSAAPDYGIFYKEGTPDYIAFSPNGGGTATPAAWVDGNGSMGIGGSLGVTGSVGIGMVPVYKLDVNGSIRASSNIYGNYLKSYGSLSVDGTSYVYGDFNLYGSGYHSYSSDGGSIFIYKNTANNHYADVMSLYIKDVDVPDGTGDSNCFLKFWEYDGAGFDVEDRIGSICATGEDNVAYYTSSDGRRKMNIEDLNEGINTVMKMQPRLFEWKSTPGVIDIGFIAQELQSIVPQAVIGSPDSDPRINPMSIDYAKLTPILTAAIQDQQKIIEDLKTRIEVLEAK